MVANAGTAPVAGYLKFFGPRFFIEADGEIATDIAAAVTKLEYKDDEKNSDQLTITVENRGLRFTDDPRFREGVRLRVRWGYANDLSASRQCVMARAKPSFPSNGVPTIQMIAFDVRQVLNRTGNPKNWGPVQSSDVARKVAERYKLDIDIEDSDDARKEDRVQAANCTDMQFLLSLADPLNWDCYIEGTTLHFHKKRFDAPPVFEFVYYRSSTGTLLSFDPSVKMNKPSKTGKAGADGKTGKSKEEEGKGEEANLGWFQINTNEGQGQVVASSPRAQGSRSGESSTDGAGSGIMGGVQRLVRAVRGKILVAASPETNDKVLKKHANGRQGKIDMKAVEASAQMIGTPRLRARQNVKISGVEKTYDGNWRIKSSTHIIVPSGQIYTVSCALTRNALNKGKKKDKNDKANDKDSADGGKPENANVRYVIVDTSGRQPIQR